MLILGGSLALIAIILLIVVLTVPRRLVFPRRYEVVETPLDGLKDADVATVGRWSRDLEALGFRRSGEYAVRLEHAAGGNALQIEKFRVWLSPDGRTWAAVKQEAFFDHAGTGTSRSWLSLILMSRSEDGFFFTTHNKSLDDGFDKNPKCSNRRLPGVQEPAALLAAHEDHVAKAGSLVVQEQAGFPRYVAVSWEMKSTWMEEHGYLRVEGEMLRATSKLGVATCLYAWNPFRVENGSRAAIVLKLAGSMGVMGALVAILQSHVPAERLDLALCGLSVAWGFAGPLMFPRLSFLSWFYVVMPALAWLEIRHGYHGWAPTAGILGAVLIGALMERLRYTGDARRMAAPISAVPALGRTGRILLAVGLLSGVVYTVLAHAVLRAPQPTSCGAYLLLLGLYLLGLGFAGAALLWCVMSLLPGRRNGKAYPVIRALGWCGVVGLTGFLSVGYSQEKDQALSGERAGQIQSALEEYRKAQGHYPAALQDLVPKYLVLIPSARAGWVEEPFEYERHATEPGNYQLFYYSAGGVKLFVSPDD